MSSLNYRGRFYAYNEKLQWHYTSRANLTTFQRTTTERL